MALSTQRKQQHRWQTSCISKLRFYHYRLGRSNRTDTDKDSKWGGMFLHSRIVDYSL